MSEKKCPMCDTVISNSDNYCVVHAAEVLLLLEGKEDDDDLWDMW